MLFKPFDLEKWFIVGFCAWLANLCKGGGGFNFNFPFRHPGTAEAGSEQVAQFFSAYMPLIIIIGSVGCVFGIVVMLVLLWLSSRGRFMFLYNVAQHKAEVKLPWKTYRQQANSLFLFRLMVGIISVICMIVFIGLITASIVFAAKSTAIVKLSLTITAIFMSCLIAPLIIAIILIVKFTKDFVVPIMYLTNLACTAAWRQFLSILAVNKLNFLLYLLFQFVLAIVISMVICAAVILTCCCAACIFVIPYLGTVLLLPVLIFTRAYSLYYLAQFGPQFNVFTE